MFTLQLQIKDGWTLGTSAHKIINAIRRCNGVCPCHNEGEDKHCPCSDYRLKNTCHCGLYVRV